MTEIRIGTHLIRIDGDILFLQTTGDLTEPDIEKYIELGNQLTAEHGGFYILNDMAGFGSVSPAVRKRVAGWVGQGGCRGAVLYGASLSSRALTTLIIGAMKMLGSQPFPVSFAKTEYDAREWIAAHRQSRAGK